MTTGIEPPHRLDRVVRWDREVDVVVVGLGVAGTCAALEAHRAGVEVLAIERASGGGGASATSEGIFYLGGGTALQRDCACQDDPEEMYKFLRSSTSTPDDESLRLFCEHSAAHFAWLEEQGVPFERRYFPGKAVSLRKGAGLLTTGNEKAWPFSELARPAPRGHQARATHEVGGGAAAMRALLAALERDAVPVLCDTQVTSLVVDGEARVSGVRIRDAAGERYLRCRAGVILATGSFSLNEEMTATHLPLVSKHAQPLGVPYNDGAGVLLAESVGAATRSMDGVIATAPIYPPGQLVKGIVVNARGERFIAEDVYHGRLAYFIEQQPDQIAFLIVDEEIFARPRHGAHRLVGAWESAFEMEVGLGVPPGSVTATLDEYNRDIAAGDDRRFHKHPDWLKSLDGPFAAFDISFSSSDYSYIPLGGVSTNHHGQALTSTGGPVPGLYAVGACAAHLAQSGMEYASGMSLGPGSFFGRRAGQHAALAKTGRRSG